MCSMETPCSSPSEGLQHGGRKLVKASGVQFASFKTFILSVKLEYIHIGSFRYGSPFMYADYTSVYCIGGNVDNAVFLLLFNLSFDTQLKTALYLR